MSVDFVTYLNNLASKWASSWYKNNIYKARDFDEHRQKFYVLSEFPYPSASGLHMGHCRSYTMMDVYARYWRMKGMNVLFPMGWDAFGLPTYNYAIKVGKDPHEVSKENVSMFKKQLQSLGLSFDWSREIDTTDPEYYKWTQWIFIQFYQHWYDPTYKRADGGKGMARPVEELPIPKEIVDKGAKAIKEYQDRFRLAYKAKMPVYYCPHCKIAVADEEVEPGGTHERCHLPLEKRYIEQWMLRITAYADRLLEDLDLVDYTDAIKEAQRNWIGRKYGAEVDFKVIGTDQVIRIFTTRIDTIYGVTFVVVSPQHSIVQYVLDNADELGVSAEDIEKIKEYVSKVTKEVNKEFNKEKTGIPLGVYVKHPLTEEDIPVFVSDFVLDEVGTGAIMGVPAHDQRDFEFAKKFGLSIRVVVVPQEVYKKGQEAIVEFSNTLNKAFSDKTAILVNSGEYSGLTVQQAQQRLLADLQEMGIGKPSKYYRMRDWIFSRQHYWGEPTPMVYCEKCGWNPVPDDQLPLTLPYLDDYRMAEDGTSPLQKATEWIATTCPICGGPAKRETDVMPNWAGSNWYYLRYLDPHNKEQLVDPKKAEYWMPVDFYDGGAEHTTMHLLYSRFVYKFLYDIGVSPTPEPYAKRRNHGLILGPDGKKMSKSRGNVINPLDVIERFGVDTVRMYVLFIAPYGGTAPWSDESASGVLRFLQRLKRYFDYSIEQQQKGEVTNTPDLESALHRLNIKVSSAIENLKFNTPVAAFMEFLNKYEKQPLSYENMKYLLRLLAPYAVFLTEEYWHLLGENISIHLSEWPAVYEDKLRATGVTVVVQINGKTRGQVIVPVEATESQVLEKVKISSSLSKYLDGRHIKRVIYVPGRIINIVLE